MVANLFRGTDGGSAITRYPVGIHHISIVRTHYQSGQVVVQSPVVLFCPSKLFGKRYQSIGGIPGGILLGIDHHKAISHITGIGFSEEVFALFDGISASSVPQFAQRTIVLIQRTLHP